LYFEGVKAEVVNGELILTGNENGGLGIGQSIFTKK